MPLCLSKLAWMTSCCPVIDAWCGASVPLPSVCPGPVLVCCHSLTVVRRVFSSIAAWAVCEIGGSGLVSLRRDLCALSFCRSGPVVELGAYEFRPLILVCLLPICFRRR